MPCAWGMQPPESGQRTSMRKPRIFLLGEDAASLFPMEECAYDAEKTLQAHLATTPDLLPGDQIDQENPRRWLLIKQEAGIPCIQHGGDFWSLDHLFVDQDSILTLVECKRSGDPRQRREVVAQMLDYAANATEYWPKGKVRWMAEETARQGNTSLAENLRELLQGDVLPSEDAQTEFWDTVDQNLATGRLRLLFVSDAIPRELRRLIEFLNNKLQDIEVLGIELKQFTNPGKQLKAFVPRVIDQTEHSLFQKNLIKKRYLTIEEQLETFPEKEIFSKIVSIAINKNHFVKPGITNFSLRCLIQGTLVTYAFCKPDNPSLQFYTEYLEKYPVIKSSLENTLNDLGYTYNGKYSITIPLGDNPSAVLHALTKAIATLNSHTAQHREA